MSAVRLARGSDEARPDPQVRGLLPRPRGRAARRGRLRASRRSAFPRRPASRPARPPTRSSRPTTTSSRRPLAVARYGEGLACVIVEPVAGNMGVVPPEPGFLEALRELCDASGALLVFDEVITGFRDRARRRAGALRRRAGPDDPRQDRRRRHADRRLRRPRPRSCGTSPRSATSTRPARSPGTRSRRRPGSRCSAGCATRPSTRSSSARPHGWRRASRALGRLPAGRRDGDPLHEGQTRSGTSHDASACDTARYGAYFRHMLERGIYVAAVAVRGHVRLARARRRGDRPDGGGRR